MALDRIMQGVIPYIGLDGAGAAADFYAKAFGATEARERVLADDGKRYMHIQLVINGGSLMLSDAFPEWGRPWQPSSSYTMQLLVEDIDAWFDRAVAAGCTVTQPVELMFWGDRFGAVKDPFGVEWAFNEAKAA